MAPGQEVRSLSEAQTDHSLQHICPNHPLQALLTFQTDRSALEQLHLLDLPSSRLGADTNPPKDSTETGKKNLQIPKQCNFL